MPELSVAILALESDQRDVLQILVEGTSIARVAAAFGGFPMGTADLILRRIHDANPDVILLDIPPEDPAPALRAIDLFHSEVPGAAVFAFGVMNQPQVIVSAMRSGAREYLDRTSSPGTLLEAFVRLTAARNKARHSGVRGKVFTVVNAKGGCGATTVAVNTALCMRSRQGASVALVDLAPLGQAALQLNVKPTFTVLDAMRNLHRLDGSLLEGYMMRHDSGLHLLAAPSQPLSLSDSPGDVARLFDLLVSHYRYVVVDASTRLDQITRVVGEISDMVLLVAHADVASLWSAARVREYLANEQNGERIHLVLNRFRKIRNFGDSDVEAATHARVFAKIPNFYAIVSTAIERGVPVASQNHSEIARCFVDLATELMEGKASEKTRSWSLFKSA